MVAVANAENVLRRSIIGNVTFTNAVSKTEDLAPVVNAQIFHALYLYNSVTIQFGYIICQLLKICEDEKGLEQRSG